MVSVQTVVQIHRSGSGCGTSFFNFSLSGSKGKVSMPLPELADAHLSSPDLGNARPRNHSLPSAGSGRQQPGEQKAIFLPKLPFSTSFSPDSSKSTGLKREFVWTLLCIFAPARPRSKIKLHRLHHWHNRNEKPPSLITRSLLCLQFGAGK